MKKEIIFLITEFLLFALYFIDIHFIEYALPFWLDIIFLAIIFIGFIIILFGVLNLNEDISIFSSQKKNNVLITNGIYKYIRHPIYAGILISMMAFAFFSVSLFKIFITSILGFVFYFKSSREEKWLIKTYSQFRNYKNKTGRFFPKKNNNSKYSNNNS